MRHLGYFVLTSIGLAISLSILGLALAHVGVLGALGVAPLRLVVFGTVAGWLGGGLSWVLSRSVAVWSVNARPYEPSDAARQSGDLTATVARLARAVGLKQAPDVAVYENPETNAFAVGWRRSQSLLVVTTGLLDGLSPAQAEPIITQELAKTASHDVSLLLFLHGMVNVFTIFPARMLAFLFGTSLRTSADETPSDGVERGLMLAFELLFAGFAAMVVRRFARGAETRADRVAGALLGREELAQSLRDLERTVAAGSHREVFVLPVKFGVSVPRYARWVSYHNSLARRAEALRSA